MSTTKTRMITLTVRGNGEHSNRCNTKGSQTRPEILKPSSKITTVKEWTIIVSKTVEIVSIYRPMPDFVSDFALTYFMTTILFCMAIQKYSFINVSQSFLPNRLFILNKVKTSLFSVCLHRVWIHIQT